MSTKTYKKPFTVYETVTAAEASAAVVTLQIAGTSGTVGNLQDDAFMYTSSIQRSGAPQTGGVFTYVSGSGRLVINNGGGYTLTTGDVITVIGTFV